MHIIALGDLFLDDQLLQEICAPQIPAGVTFRTWQWETGGLEQLQAYNIQCEQEGPEGVELPEELYALAAEAEVLITQFCPVNARMLASPRLKCVAVGRSGVQNVNLEAASANGVAVLNTVGRNAQAVAEYCIGMMLAEARNIGRAHAALKQGQWRKEYLNDACVPELPGKRLGLIGFGQIGRMMAKKLAGFDMDLVTYDPYANEADLAAHGVTHIALDELMASSDFVSVHAKLTEETRHIVSYERLCLMKPTAYFINTARAELVDEAGLVRALQEQRIAGAAIDVFMTEPPAADDPLLHCDNCTLSPHQAGVTSDAYRTTAQLVISNLAGLWREGGQVRNHLNPDTQAALDELRDCVQA